MKRGVSIFLMTLMMQLWIPVVRAEEAATPKAGSDNEFSFVGSKKCKACHIKEYKSWSMTGMAQAFEKLKAGVAAEAKHSAGLDPDKDYTKDAACVRCHVTGYGKPGGFVDIETTPDLAGVGCESCHGPGGTYTKPEHMSLKNKSYKRSSLVAVGLVENVSAAQCVGCHNSESPYVAEGYVFDFEASKKKGLHENFPLMHEH